MSKRLIRIKGDDVFSKLEHHIGTEMNAVLQNGKTHFGVLNSISPEQLSIADTRNHLHEIRIFDIYEIVLDTTASLENIAIK